MSNGPKFWDSLCGPSNGAYPEYVAPENWFGEYVAKLEHGKGASPTSEASQGAASGSSGTLQPAAKLPRWKRRTPEQIEANKAAQKRFREKKKAKLEQASTTVDQLSEQAKSLDVLTKETGALEEENLALEAALWQKEAELSQIKMELDEQTPQARYDEKLQSRCIPSFISKPVPLGERIDRVAKQWRKEKDDLEELLASAKLEPGSQAPAGRLREVEKRSLAVMGQCMEIMSLGGPQLDVLLRTLEDRQEDLMREGSIEKYAQLAHSLNLSEDQARQLLEVRASVLQRLERLYMDRQGLNMRVMGLLMAQSSSAAGQAGAQQTAAELRAALAELRKNLQAEQRLESEHHHAVFRRVLSPIQGAWFIVKAYPSHCDTLAFMHGLAELQKRSAAA